METCQQFAYPTSDFCPTTRICYHIAKASRIYWCHKIPLGVGVVPLLALGLNVDNKDAFGFQVQMYGFESHVKVNTLKF